jgi:alkylation response protein AidB-like acyl-CoA dehydrogenase
VPSESPIKAAERLAPLAGSLSDQAERDRALAPELVEQMRDSGLFHLCLPRSAGGLEASAAELFETLETLGRGDGACGWCAMVASTSSMLGAYLPAEQAEAIFDRGRSIAGGVFAPRGRARRAGDQLLLSGRWPFVSGIGHSDWMFGGCIVEGEQGPELIDGGRPDIRLVALARGAVEVIDTWNVSGLCATGSHDVAAEGLTVPASRGVSLFADAPREPGALYAFPLFGLLALGIAAVALGIARGSIDALLELAGEKRPAPGSRSLAERPTMQVELARSEAALRGARALALEQIALAWEAAEQGGALADELKVGLRLAATHATATAAEVANAMYRAGGGSSIYAESPLQRRFRDANVATQHMMVAPSSWELSGRLLFGLPTDTSQL